MGSTTTYSTRLNIPKPGTGLVRWDDLYYDMVNILDRLIPALRGTVGETIDVADVVCSWNGTIYLASIADTLDEALRHGLAINATELPVDYGEEGIFTRHATMTEGSPYWPAWTPDAPLYLSATPGSMTHTPAFSAEGKFQYLGRALSETTILFDPKPPIAPSLIQTLGYQYKDGSSNPGNDFTDPAWDNSTERVTRTITFDGSTQDIEMLFEFWLPDNWIGAFPSTANVFEIDVSHSNGAMLTSVTEIIDSAGGNDAVASVSSAATSLTTLGVPGSKFVGSYTAGGRVVVRVKFENNAISAGVTTISANARLNVPCMD